MALEAGTKVYWKGDTYVVGVEAPVSRYYDPPRGKVALYDLCSPANPTDVTWHDIPEDELTVIEEAAP